MIRALAALALAFTPLPLAAQAPPDAALQRTLQERLAAVVAASAGRMGISALHLESGRAVAINGGERFPMASTYKIAVAATMLSAIEEGRFRLDQMITLDERIRVRSDGITSFAPHPGVALSVLNLIELSLTRSDNTATDMLVAAVGGPAAVDAWLRRAGIDGQRVDRDTAAILHDDFGLVAAPGSNVAGNLAGHFPPQPWLPSGPDHPINPAFDNDPRDTSTPDAMVRLLTRLHRGELLTPAHTRLLFEVLARTRTGTARVRSVLPPGTIWAHKTGSLAGISADVGVLTLPDGSHVALALFIRGAPDPAARDRSIAEAGRLIWDSFRSTRR
ncbi:MAG: class A beta-lactamase [Sphingomonas sp.]